MLGRNRPLAALRALSELAKNPDDLPKVFTIIDSLPGLSEGRLLRRMEADANGRRLLETRPNLAARLADRTSLSALPAGTLGRAYAEFAERAGITPQGIVEASVAGGRNDVHDENLRFVSERMRDAHDVWHVVTGYGVDVAGEVSLLAFTYAQSPQPGIGLICLLAYAHFVPGVNEMLRKAYRRGKEAAWLPSVVWEDLLERPLDEVREMLGVGTPPTYTPITTAALREAGRISVAA